MVEGERGGMTSHIAHLSPTHLLLIAVLFDGIIHDFASRLKDHLVTSTLDVFHLLLSNFLLFHVSILLFQDLVRSLVLADRHLVSLVLLLLLLHISLLEESMDSLSFDLQILPQLLNPLNEMLSLT